jgi:hypothetical protein
MDGIVEVRIRYAEFGKGAYLTDWPIRDLAELITIVQAWLVLAEGRGPFSGDFGTQFVVEGTHAYFEIVVGAQDE